jgi:hypothetical protein
MNRVRQVIIAAHNFASATGRFPSPIPTTDGEGGFFGDIAPYIDRGQLVPSSSTTVGGVTYPVYQFPIFQCPEDPSLDYFGVLRAEGNPSNGNCSFAVNAFALAGAPRLESTFPDGTANTLALCEHYARCANVYDFVWDMDSVGTYSGPPSPPRPPLPRRATFADHEPGDAIPGLGSSPVKTFQMSPAVADCDATIPQTAHIGGMVSAMVDGSVRMLASSISTAVFWAAVTPAGGEVVGADW